MRPTAFTLAIAAIPASAVACGSDSDEQAHETASGAMAREATGAQPLPQGSEPVELDPADFTSGIDNPYWPMDPGARRTVPRC